MMKILLTGDLGFIGTRIGKRLKAELSKTIIIGYDIERKGDDIRDLFDLERMFAYYNFDCVLHLAARAGVRMGEQFPEEYITTNILGTENVLRLAEKYKVQKVIMFSSSSIYGKGDGPISMYGITKKASEMLTIRFKIPSVWIVRPFTVYGEHGRIDQVIFKWINQIKAEKPISYFGGKESSRYYTYVGDVARAVEMMIVSAKLGIMTVDLAGERMVKLKELLDIFLIQLGSSLPTENFPLPDVDDVKIKPNDSAFQLLSWKPEQNFHEKVKEIIISEFI